MSSVHLANDTRLFYRECVSLAKAYEVYLVALGDSDGEWYGVKVRAVKKQASRLKRFFFTIPVVFLRGLAVNAKVYHFHDPELIPAGLLLRLLGKKVIYDIHEDVTQLMKLKKWVLFPRFVSMVYKFCEWFALRSFYIVVSESAYQKLYPRKRTTVIHNFAFIDKLSRYREPNRPAEGNHIFYIGSIDELYCHFEALEAIYLLKQKNIDLKVSFIGSLSDKILRKMEALPFYNLISQQLKFYGYLSAEEGFQYSRDAVLALCLVNKNVNSYESYPRKMFEYMSVGLPFVTSDFPLYKDVAEKYHCGLCIDSSSPEAIAQAIETLLKDAELRKKMGHHGIEAAIAHFDWQQEERKLLALYNEILG